MIRISHTAPGLWTKVSVVLNESARYHFLYLYRPNLSPNGTSALSLHCALYWMTSRPFNQLVELLFDSKYIQPYRHPLQWSVFIHKMKESKCQTLQHPRERPSRKKSSSVASIFLTLSFSFISKVSLTIFVSYAYLS